MAETGNELLLDAMIRHQIALMRLSGTINGRIVELLDATEAELRVQVERALSGLSFAEGVDVTRPSVVKKLEILGNNIAGLREAAMNDVLDEWTAQLRDLASVEPAFAAAAVNASMPIIFDMVIPAPALLRALVREQPFEGQTLKEWASQLAEADQRRIMNEIRIGMVQGESINDIARRIVGSAQFNGTDGVTQITRNEAVSITRTAVNFFSNAARQEFFDANSDIFDEELFVATLDSRTTPVCRANDGKRFAVGKGPKPPLHWNCRSLRVAVVTDNPIGNRPFNPTTEKMLVRQFARENGLGSIAVREDLPHGTKGSFDDFARKQVRGLIGRTPAATTYQQFLKRQSAEFQDDVLGKTKGKLFRKGDLALDRFVDRGGREFTLRELVIRDRDAFVAAGLNPDEYL